MAQGQYPLRPNPAPPRPTPSARSRPPRIDPILFWNETALQLDVLDHSLDAKDSRAPGPCASSRALALAHIVMADAAAAAYACDFEGLYVRGGRFPENEYADVFVGAAAARILGHIYSTPAHTHLIGSQRQRFLKFFDSRALAAWNAVSSSDATNSSPPGGNGIQSSRPPCRRLSAGISCGAESTTSTIQSRSKFYGVNWSRIPPLSPGLPLASFDPGERSGAKPRLYAGPGGSQGFLAPSYRREPPPSRFKIGLFWAYDAARLIGTPPRLYNQIVAQIAEADELSTPEMARLLALCNLAMADSGIVCWEAKYRYQIWRPVIGIPMHSTVPTTIGAHLGRHAPILSNSRLAVMRGD